MIRSLVGPLVGSLPGLLVGAALLVTVAGCEAARSATPAASASMQPSVSPSTDGALRAAIAGPARTDAERARDGARHPLETLGFFALRDDATVVELWPGGGYYTAILAPVLAPRGKLVITQFDPHGDPKSEETQDAQRMLARLGESPAAFGRVEKQTIAPPDVRLGPDGSADFVLTFRNVHNWIDAGYADRVFAAAFRVLRQGGVLGVEEHRGRPGMTDKEIVDTGYVPEEAVVRLAERAGFRLEARSEVNANPRDTKDHPNGVWSLPPTLAGKDQDRARYLAIGESDRMTLRFVKP